LKIIVTIKQVPETGNVKMDPVTGTMKRDGVESIVNPLDLYAVEEAIRLKNEFGGEIIAITMGPPKADRALREVISMGCDSGILLSNKSFAGADTWSTSYVLAQAIKKLGEYDLILCGERATDGDTGQVGPGIATWLDITFTTYVSGVKEVKENSLVIERMVETGYEILEIENPSLLTVIKEINYPRLPSLRGKQKARKLDIPVWGPEEIDVENKNLGLKGSPTRVVRISKPKVSRNGELFVCKNDQDIENAVGKMFEFLESKEII